MEEPLGRDEATEFVLSYQLFEHPPLFIDYGRITLAAGQASALEIWTLRRHAIGLPADASRFWVQTWIDGKAVPFVIRSSRAFSVSPTMAWAEQLPAGSLVLVCFEPGGIHRYASLAG